MITKFETRENGRDKIIYTIEDAGRDQLKNWLELPVDKDELRMETLLKLFFGNEAGESIALSHIRRFEEKALAELPYLKNSAAALQSIQADDTAHTYYLLTAMFGVKIYEAYLEWCTEAEKLLKERGKR